MPMAPNYYISIELDPFNDLNDVVHIPIHGIKKILDLSDKHNMITRSKMDIFKPKALNATLVLPVP